MRYEGIAMDGPKKGERIAHWSPKMQVETLDEEDVLLPVRMMGKTDVEPVAMIQRTYTYVWVEAGHGRLPGWYLGG